MDYRTFIPDHRLTSFIKCFWSLEAPAEANAERQRIVPDGCMEMIFHYGDLYSQFFKDGSTITQPRSFIFGQITSPLEIAPLGISGIVAARFFPDGFIPFNSMALYKMENRAVPLNELYGDEGIALESSVLAASDNEARIKLIENFLLQKLSVINVGDLAKKSVEILLASKGHSSIASLADQLQTNKRQLERRFSSVIGLSPKQLSKIIRLQAALKRMEQKQFTSLTELAYENGYFDQAHFIKDFKEFTGISPKRFYSDSMKMSALFIGTE
jgi:AraC-like DNA-binding protein